MKQLKIGWWMWSMKLCFVFSFFDGKQRDVPFFSSSYSYFGYAYGVVDIIYGSGYFTSLYDISIFFFGEWLIYEYTKVQEIFFYIAQL